MDQRVKQINNFTTKMAELKILRHPLRSEVKITLCGTERDLYGDTDSDPEEGIDKVCVIKKSTDLDYINSALGILMDEGEALPWMVYMTLIGLPRTLQHGDYLTVDNLVYKISRVRPLNRTNPDVIRMLIHPDRDDFDTTVSEEEDIDDQGI